MFVTRLLCAYCQVQQGHAQQGHAQQQVCAKLRHGSCLAKAQSFEIPHSVFGCPFYLVHVVQ